MKILQLIQTPQLRGAEIFACQLANQLVEDGHEVFLVSLLPGASELPFKGKHIKLERPITKRFFDWQGWKQLAQEIKDFEPDVVQANAGDTLKYAVLSRLFFRWTAPIVFRNASTISLYIKSPVVKWWNAFLFRQVAHVVSVSQASKVDFVRMFPFVADRITVIPIGLECNPLPHPVPAASLYILHVGGFTFEKNHIRLLYIFKQLRQIHPELSLWLAGDGPLREQIEQQAEEMGLASAIRFLGFQKDVMVLMQSTKLLVLPSVIEGLPGVILEAMYCKTPVVAYDVGGISEVVKNRKTGWLVPKGDEAGFVDAVYQVLQGDGVAEIVENAYRLVTEQYDNRQIAKRFEEVYRRVVGR